MLDLCAVGDLKWLINLTMAHLPVPGEMTPVSGVERLLGNDAAIVALLAARLGMHTQLVPTNTIARSDGQPLIDLLQREKVDVSLIDVEGVVTPTTFFLSLLSSDERAWLVEDCAFHYNAAFDELPDYTFAYLDFYEEHSEKRLALLQKWSQAKVRCFVNLSSSHHEEKVQQLTHLSSHDIVQVRRGGSVDDALAWGRSVLQLCNAGAIVITLGSVGAVLVERQDEYFVAAEPIQPLRTMGAGASFSAGFLDALNKGTSYREATVRASKYAAAFCTSNKHPLEAIKTWSF